MDRILMSPDIGVHDFEHNLADALAVGSDHALVRAVLAVR
jgi:hypothetical protein